MNTRPLKKVIDQPKKRIALVAHDGMKAELFAWVANHRDQLAQHELCGSGTTGTVIREQFGLEVHSYRSGPLGGDQQIGAAIAEGKIDLLIFFWDPLAAQPHDPDVKALLRIAVLYDVPVAMSPTAANYLFSSPMMINLYEKYVINADANVRARADQLDGEDSN